MPTVLLFASSCVKNWEKMLTHSFPIAEGTYCHVLFVPCYRSWLLICCCLWWFDTFSPCFPWRQSKRLTISCDEFSYYCSSACENDNIYLIKFRWMFVIIAKVHMLPGTKIMRMYCPISRIDRLSYPNTRTYELWSS